MYKYGRKYGCFLSSGCKSEPLDIHVNREKWTREAFPYESLGVCDKGFLARTAETGKKPKCHGESFGIQGRERQNVSGDQWACKLCLLTFAVALSTCRWLVIYIVDT